MGWFFILVLVLFVLYIVSTILYIVYYNLAGLIICILGALFLVPNIFPI